MSYVRWICPDENGKLSNVYVYEDVNGGWTTMLTDGRQFNDPTPGTCADRLAALKADGLAVPQYCIDDLRAEQAVMLQGAH